MITKLKCFNYLFLLFLLIIANACSSKAELNTSFPHDGGIKPLEQFKILKRTEVNVPPYNSFFIFELRKTEDREVLKITAVYNSKKHADTYTYYIESNEFKTLKLFIDKASSIETSTEVVFNSRSGFSIICEKDIQEIVTFYFKYKKSHESTGAYFIQKISIKELQKIFEMVQGF